MDEEESVLASGERLGPMDATLVNIETATTSSTIGLICRFDGPIPFDDYVKDFRRHRIQRLPRFSQVVVPVPLSLNFPTWEDDPNFDIDDHLHEIHLDSPGSERDLMGQASQLLGRRIDFSRPPWDIYVVNGLEEGGSAVIFHMHHCVSDGVGFMKVLQAVFDSAPTPFDTDAPEEALPQASPLPGSFRRMGRALRDSFARRPKESPSDQAVADAAERKAAEKERSKAFGVTMKEFMQSPGVRLPFNAPLSGSVHHGSVSFDLEDFRLITNAFGGTVNDVLLTVLAGAIERLSEEVGIEVADKYCRVYQAANTRTRDERGDWGNRLAFMPALVPLGLTDPGERLRQIAAYTKKTKELGVREAADKLVRGFQSKLPPPLAKLGLRLIFSRPFQKLSTRSKKPPPFNIYLTNVRLPEFTGYLGGRRMTGMTGLAPLALSTGVTCAAVNYGGRLYVGITADLVTTPDVDGFSTKLQDALDELLVAARDETSPATTTP